MQWHKIVARIILLILSVINFALAAPVLVRMSEVRLDVVDVAEDVTTASQKRWNPSYKSWTNAALADGTSSPKSLGLSESDYRLEQELRPHDPRSPVSPDPGDSHPLPVDPPSPAHHNLLLDIDSNTSPRPGKELKDGSHSGSHSTGSMSLSKPPSSSPSHDSDPWPSGSHSALVSEPTESDPGPSRRPFSPLDPKQTKSDPGPSRRPFSPSDSGQSTSAHSPSDIGQSTWARPPSDPGPVWPYSSLESKQTESDPGPSRKMPHSPSDSGQSTPTYPPSGPEPEWPYSPLHSKSDPGPSRSPYSPLGSKQTVSDPGPLRRPYSPSDSVQSTSALSLSDLGQSTWAHPPSDPGGGWSWSYSSFNSRVTESDPGPSRKKPYSPSVSEQSTSAYPPPDFGPPTQHSPPSPGPQQPESESIFSKLLKGKFKPRTQFSGSRSVNGASKGVAS